MAHCWTVRKDNVQYLRETTAVPAVSDLLPSEEEELCCRVGPFDTRHRKARSVPRVIPVASCVTEINRNDFIRSLRCAKYCLLDDLIIWHGMKRDISP